MTRDDFDNAIQTIEECRRHLRSVGSSWYSDKLGDARNKILIYVEEISPNHIKYIKSKRVKHFISAFSLFTAFILFIILAEMPGYNYDFVNILILFSEPIMIAYVIFLLCYIGFSFML